MYDVLAVLHPADLFRDPSMRIPSHRDWAKAPKILSGEWPKPVPERIIVRHDTWWGALFTEQFTGMVAEALSADFLCIDTEYAQDTRFLTLLGVGYPSDGTI